MSMPIQSNPEPSRINDIQQVSTPQSTTKIEAEVKAFTFDSLSKTMSELTEFFKSRIPPSG